ncbi:hypothetical protein BpHYR1_011667 [Brachionus plicatilis]|uniref:Uncharacterized protein n=1 Tax=Brachionus plicatilis TaxID=10195 RepID=A0A3M7RS41_BRAPC|nr:hypothetical protein BpHYR1_011667 [Brachionus plicatilis]
MYKKRIFDRDKKTPKRIRKTRRNNLVLLKVQFLANLLNALDREKNQQALFIKIATKTKIPDILYTLFVIIKCKNLNNCYLK